MFNRKPKRVIKDIVADLTYSIDIPGISNDKYSAQLFYLDVRKGNFVIGSYNSLLLLNKSVQVYFYDHIGKYPLFNAIIEKRIDYTLRYSEESQMFEFYGTYSIQGE